ncbi:MAG: PD-(D/E)XK nuclease family protein, partial [bacterium]
MMRAFRNDFSKTFIVATAVDRSAELRRAAAMRQLVAIKMVDPSRFLPELRPDYLLHMSEDHGIAVHLAAILPPFFPYVREMTDASSSRIAFLKKLVAELTTEGQYEASIFQPPSASVRLWNDCPPIPIPGYADVRREWTYPVVSESVDLVLTADGENQIHAAIAHIASLLLAGIDPAEIKIVNAAPADVRKLTSTAKMYGFSIVDSSLDRLDRYPLASRFLAECVKQSPAATLTAWLADPQIAVVENQTVLSVIAGIVSRYGDDLERHQEILVHEFSVTPVPQENITGVVECVSLEAVSPQAASYYLILNYEDRSLPPVVIDDGFLTDAEKAMIGMETSMMKNGRIRETLGRKLASLPHCLLFRPLLLAGRETRSADILDPWRRRREIPFVNDATLPMSRPFAELLYAKMRHQDLTFGNHPPVYPALAAAFAKNHMMYDPQFGSLSPTTIASLRMRSVVLSATSLEAYHKCRFRFLCDHILRLAPYESTLPQELGNLAHKALRDAFTGNGSAEMSAEAEARRLGQTDARTGVLGVLLAKRLAIVETRLRSRLHPNISEFSHEGEYSYVDERYPGFIVKGTIDRVMILPKNDQNWTFVVDYKTGNPSFSMVEFSKGTDIQPVFYLHLLERTHAIPGFIPAGFYYQPVTIGRLVRSEKKDMILEALKQDGRTLADAGAIAAVGGPEALHNVRYKNDGSFYADSAVITAAVFKDMLTNIDRMIALAIAAVMDGTFIINPESRQPG